MPEGGVADDDVWYKFVATSTTHTVTVTPTTLVNASFQVFSGTCGTPTSLACINATTGALAETTNLTGLTIGTTYLIRIYSAGNTGQGNFSICVNSPLSNDNCSGAIAVATNPDLSCTNSISEPYKAQPIPA